MQIELTAEDSNFLDLEAERLGISKSEAFRRVFEFYQNNLADLKASLADARQQVLEGKVSDWTPEKTLQSLRKKASD